VGGKEEGKGGGGLHPPLIYYALSGLARFAQTNRNKISSPAGAVYNSDGCGAVVLLGKNFPCKGRATPTPVILRPFRACMSYTNELHQKRQPCRGGI